MKSAYVNALRAAALTLLARQRLRRHTASLVRDIAVTLRTDGAIKPRPTVPFGYTDYLNRLHEVLE